MDRHEAFAILRKLSETEKIHIDQAKNRQTGVGEAPTTTQVCPDTMGEHLCKRTLSVFTNNSASICVQQPMPPCLLVRRGEAKRFHYLKAELVF